jgi:hypothetical protein
LNIFNPDPLANLCANIEKDLGSSNRDVKRMATCILEQGEIQVTVAGNDNFTSDMINQSLQLDIKHVLKTIVQSNTSLSYQGVVVVVTFPLVDFNGNVTESNVVIATYKKERIQQVNFDNFLTENIYQLANQDSLFVHPAVKP